MIHSPEAEAALLGAIIMDPNIFPEVLDVISKPEWFYISKNARVFAAMLELFQKNKPLDIVEIAEITSDLKYLMELSDVTPTSANALEYAKIVKDKAIRRELHKACVKGMEIIKENREIDDIAGDIQANVYHAVSQNYTGRIITAKELAKHRWEQFHAGKIEPSGVKTGFADLDKIITCLKNGELTILAGRTSMGKTTLALDIARNVAKQDIPVLIFTLEMTGERIADRIICANGMIPGQLYREGKFANRERLEKAISEFYEMPIYIYDKRVTTTEIRAKSMQIKDLGFVVVDFITLIKDRRTGNVSTADHVGEIAKRLQEIAKELNVPFLVLSQMNREIDKRENKKPKLSDLRDSGNIEEAADNVIFIHRPERYNEDEPKDIAHLYIEKQRDGPTGVVKVKYFDIVPTFRDLSKY